MSMLHVHVACPCCISMFMLHGRVHAASLYSCCMSCSYPYCMSTSRTILYVHVHAACSCSYCMLHVLSMLHVHVHGHAAYQYVYPYVYMYISLCLYVYIEIPNAGLSSICSVQYRTNLMQSSIFFAPYTGLIESHHQSSATI
jgi:hypothetical protein